MKATDELSGVGIIYYTTSVWQHVPNNTLIIENWGKEKDPINKGDL